jgi:hypothetical protein
MKEVAILLLLALMLNGCGNSTPTVQAGASGIWEAQLFGGNETASGFSFITQFTVNLNGPLSITSFQFLTYNPGDSSNCFPINGGTVTGSMPLQVLSNNTVSGTINYVVTSGGNTLTLNGTVTGTASENGSGTNATYTLTSATVSGTWAVTGGTGCSATGGSFTMIQS